jgi:cytidylate kinase
LADRGKQEPKYTTIQEALESSQNRMAKLRQRLLNVYGVDFTDKANYTKVIDTTDKSFDQVLEEFENFIKTLKK